MNKNEKLLHAIGAVSDDKIIIAENYQKRKSRHILILMPAVAACFIIVAAFYILPMFSNNPLVFDNSQNTPPTRNTPIVAIPPDYEPEFIGLPVNNFCLSEIEAYAEFCRAWAAFNIPDFFRTPEYEPLAFAFVRVTGVEQQKKSSRSADWPADWIEQTSTLQILSTVRSNIDNLPDTITLEQSTGGYFTSVGGPTALLREGAVYLLPLWYDQEYNWWHNISDYDVLFEVDDRGLIWSHSRYEGFNKYDGKTASQLAQAIKGATEDEDFEVYTTWFGQTVSNWYVFAEVTVLSETTVDLPRHGAIPAYKIMLNNIISRPEKNPNNNPNDYFGEWENGDTIEVIHWDWETEPELFKIGERYLMFTYPDYLGAELYADYAAKINPDETIAPLYNQNRNWNVFDGFDGYTVEQMVDIAKRAVVFYEAY